MVRLERRIFRAADQRGDRLGGLGTLAEPVVDALEIELEVVLLEGGIVPAENLKELDK